MNRTLAFALAVSGLALSATAASAQAGGSYLATCTNVYQRGSILSAECETPNGYMRPTRIDLNGCRGGDIANANGRLVCSRRRAAPPPDYYGGRPQYQPQYQQPHYDPYRPRW